jgi:bifunctional UDP-N-acetylglucosamine pyrophosphorylase/glucosamine-1-phosphate N-acetyltransferase
MATIPAIDSSNCHLYSGSIDLSQWSVMIPAAGRGSRLGFDKPKILYPLAGKTILEWLIERFSPFVSRFVLVLSPDGEPHVRPLAESLLGSRLKIAIQPSPKGMGDAIQRGLTAIDTPRLAIVWGDQPALRPSTIANTLALHSGPLAPAITFPTLWREKPYIHFERDASGRLLRLLQAREGDSMPERGEGDAGFFCFEKDTLAQSLDQMSRLPEGYGASTGEFLLLPGFPLAAQNGLTVLTPSLVSVEESVGVNSPADAEYLDSLLSRC